MKKITESLKMEFRLLHRSKWFYVTFALFLVYFGYECNWSLSMNMAGEAVNATAYIVQGGIFLFLIYGILLVRAEENCDAQEVFQTIPGGFRSKVLAKTIFIVLIVLGISLGGYLVLSVIYAMYHISAMFYIDALFYILLYWTLPMVISGIVGQSLGIVMRSKAVYPITILLGIFLGPLNRVAFITVTKFLPKWQEQLMLMMNLGQSDPFRVYNLVYGFPLESFRWISKFLVLITVSLILYLVVYWKLHQKKRTPVVASVLIVCLLLGAYNWKVFSGHVEDLTSKQAINEDDDYYLNYKQEIVSDDTPFLINRYEMNMDVKAGLSNIVKMKVETKKPVKQLIFTLYHGLKVESVQLDEENVSYSQSGDQFSVASSKELQPGQTYNVVVEYKGKTPQRFFANEYAVMLPGFFPWFPVPGAQPIAYVVNTVKYHLYHFENKPEFVLRYNSSKPVYSNLDVQTDGTWTGKSSTGVTIVSGAMEKVSAGDTKVIRPYALYNLSSDLNEDLAALDRLNKEISTSLQAPYQPIHNVFYLETRVTNKPTLWLEDGYAIMDTDVLANNDNTLKMDESKVYLLVESNVRTVNWEKQDEKMTDLFVYAYAYSFTQEKKMLPQEQTYFSRTLKDIVQSYDSKNFSTFQKLSEFLQSHVQDTTLLQAFYQEWLQHLQSNDKVDWGVVATLLDTYEKRNLHVGTSN